MAADIEIPKPLTFALLRLLADGEFHSGEVLAQKMGVSRASVNNALRNIERYGLVLYSVRGRGYCLLDAPQWLDKSRVNILLAQDANDFHLEIMDSTPSTNTLLLQQSSAGAPGGSVLAAELQTMGRGRQGRLWHSGLGNALTFSLLWRFECGLSGLAGLSLAAGLGLIRALKSLGINGASLKWPNDILGLNGKMAGILVEAQGDMLGPSAVVIGVGINLSLPQQVSAHVDQHAAGMSQLINVLPDRNLLLAVMLRELARVLRQFSAGGFAELRAEWESCHYYQQQPVQLLLPDGSRIRGIVRGVNQDGALSVEISSPESTQPEMRIFHAGEISLRSEDYVAV